MKILACLKNMKVRIFRKKLKKLDLEPIAFQLRRNGKTRQQTKRAIAKYLMFLFLAYLYPNLTIVPTQEIDEVWHHHISDTAKYKSDCQLLFGRFLDHFPYFGLRGEADWQDLTVAFSQTKELFSKHFGTDVLANSNNKPSQKPAACEPLRSTQSQYRPRADFEVAEVIEAFPFEETKLG